MTETLLLTGREAAKALSICERTLYTLTKSGEIPAVRIGRCVRYSVAELQEWVRRGPQKNAKTVRMVLDRAASIV